MSTSRTPRTRREPAPDNRHERGIDARPNGRYRVRATGPDGINRYVGTFDSFEAAKRARDAERGVVALGMWTSPDAGSETFTEYARRWLDRRDGDLAEKTMQGYREDAERWIFSPVPFGRRSITLGDLPLNKITTTVVADWQGAVRAHARQRVHDRRRAAAASRTRTDAAAARAWAQAAGIKVGAVGRLSPTVMAAWQDAGCPRPTVEVEVSRRDGKRTAAHAYALAHSIVLAAKGEGLFPFDDPFTVKGAGADKAPERTPATPAQVVSCSLAMPARWQTLVPVTAWGYLRKGEVLGLQVRDVTFTRDRAGQIVGAKLEVRRAAKFITGRGMVVGDLKTKSSRRDVPLPGATARALAAHMAMFTADRQDAHIFTGETGEVVDTAALGRAWRRARKVAGRPDLRFHDLRHTGATEARRSGAELSELQRLLGHSTLQAVAVYQHVSIEDLELVAMRLDARLAAA